MLIVIPTSRSVSLEYLQPLIDFGARLIVVDDSEGSIKIDHPQFSTYTWKDQDRMLGGDVIAIPRRNGACGDFGVSTSHGGNPTLARLSLRSTTIAKLRIAISASA